MSSTQPFPVAYPERDTCRARGLDGVMCVKVWSAVAEGSWSVLRFFTLFFLRFLQPKQWEWNNGSSRAKCTQYFSKKRHIYLAKSLGIKGIDHPKMLFYLLSLMFFQTHVTFLLEWNRKSLKNVVGLFFYYKWGLRLSRIKKDALYLQSFEGIQ